MALRAGISDSRCWSFRYYVLMTETETDTASDAEAADAAEADAPAEAAATEAAAVADEAEIAVSEATDAAESASDAEAAVSEAAAPADDAKATAPEATKELASEPEVKADQKPVTPAKPQDRFSNGSIVKGTVTSVSFQEAELDLGDGQVGVLNCRHYTSDLMIDLTSELKVGDELEAAVLIRADHRKRVVLSRIWARSQQAWKKINEAKKSGGLLEVMVAQVLDSGLTVLVDEVRGFLPLSLMTMSELVPEANAEAETETETAKESTAEPAAEEVADPTSEVASEATSDAAATEEPGSDALDDAVSEAPGAEAPADEAASDAAAAEEAAEKSADEAASDEATTEEPVAEDLVDEASEASEAEEPATEESELEATADSVATDAAVEPEPAADPAPDDSEAGAEPAADPAEALPPDTTTALDNLVGQTLVCKVVEANQPKNRLVVSHNAALWALRREAAREILAGLSKDDIVEGTVVRVADYGAFVDLGDVTGLLHRRDTAWNHGLDPEKLFTIGDTIACRVAKINMDKTQVMLSLRTGQNPISRLKVGQVLTGKVDRLAFSGAIVALDPEAAGEVGVGDEAGGGAESGGGTESGAEPAQNQLDFKCQLYGFVPVSEMAENSVKQPQRLVVPGDEVAVKVMGVDRKKSRVDLSIIEAIIPAELLS